MIVVNIKGGLGNQLFQYALGQRIRQKGLDVFYHIDDSVNDHSGLRINYFVNDVNILSEHDIHQMSFYLQLFCISLVVTNNVYLSLLLTLGACARVTVLCLFVCLLVCLSVCSQSATRIRRRYS